MRDSQEEEEGAARRRRHRLGAVYHAACTHAAAAFSPRTYIVAGEQGNLAGGPFGRDLGGAPPLRVVRRYKHCRTVDVRCMFH